MEAISSLGIGPMSPIIIESVFSYSQKHRTPLMLISSKNQVDYDRGYVFTTPEYRKYLNKLKRKYPRSKVYICRDHCGPGHNSIFDIKDVYKTIDSDLENEFDLIHIDFCFHRGSYEDVLKESKKAIEYVQKRSPKTLIEIGTDENSGSNVENTTRLEEQMNFFTSFCKPHFFVTQTGSLIKEINQVGVFHDDYLKKVKLLSKKFSLNIKEHNADYLSTKDIRKRRRLVGAVNVAPQFGVLQTQITIQKALLYGVDPTDYLNLCYRSHKWEKWLYNNTKENKFLCSLIAGHYNFNSPEYKHLYDQISKHEDFNSTIQEEMHKVFHHYVSNLHS